MDREEFMNHVYWVLSEDTDNNRANSIIDAADEYAENAAKEALEGKDTNVPTNSALDHIHNVVSEREYQRGYEQAKAEYDHKLTVIKNTIKDYWYIKGKEDGKADAVKWIPIKIRPLTDDEKEQHPEWDYGFECEMPDDGQEILITYKNRNKRMVCEDTFFDDGDCCYLDSGLDFDDEVLAWAEKPKPWEGE